MYDMNVSSYQLMSDQKFFKTFEAVQLYFIEFKITFHFLALKLRSRTSVVQVSAALCVSLCIWILAVCGVSAGGGT
jgi:hypothetical protein